MEGERGITVLKMRSRRDSSNATSPGAPKTPFGMWKERPAHRLWRNLLRWIGVCLVVYWILAFALTHVPFSNESHEVAAWSIPHIDKVAHIAIYTGLSFLLSVWFGMRRKSRGAIAVALVVSLVLAAYAALDEITQGPVGRDPDVKDWFADLAGINLGLCGFFTLRRWLGRADRQRSANPPRDSLVRDAASAIS